MPDPGPGFSRPCPSCGRHVPRTVTVCRCGVEVPGGSAASPDEDAAQSGGLSAVNVAIGALLLVVVGATAYWSLSRPPLDYAAPRPRVGSTPAMPAGSISIPGGPAGDPATAGLKPSDDGPGSPDAAPEPADPLEDVVARVMPAVVLVETSTNRGSGFYVRFDTVLTNAHVVKNEAFVKLRQADGTTVTARVDSKSPAYDIAVLKVTVPAPNQAVIALGTADTLRPGQEVFTIGSPFGTLQNSVTRGVVSGLRQSGAATMVQNDATAHPGSSGGPLLDRKGVAIGITTMGDADKLGINYAVAIDHARAILDGRVVDSAAAPLSLADVKAIEPAIPAAQRAADEGARAFAAAMADLARNADAFDVEWKKFRQACYSGAIPASYGREWFVMLSPRPITPSQVSSGACATFVNGFQPDANRLGAAIRGALDSARRAGVLPGTVRDTLSANRLEFDGWDR